MAKSNFESRPNGGRKMRSPRTRWLKDGENDLCRLRVKKANNKENSIFVVKKAKALRGP
jgi:hypothetical protein